MVLHSCECLSTGPLLSVFVKLLLLLTKKINNKCNKNNKHFSIGGNNFNEFSLIKCILYLYIGCNHFFIFYFFSPGQKAANSYDLLRRLLFMLFFWKQIFCCLKCIIITIIVVVDGFVVLDVVVSFKMCITCLKTCLLLSF